MSAPTVRINIVTTVYPPPDFDGADVDYMPDGESDMETREMTFSELVAFIANENVTTPSSSPPPAKPGPGDWLSCETYQDYRSGDWMEKSVHFSRDNAPRFRKYWRWAWRAAGIIK